MTLALRPAVKALLKADSSLMAVLTGGAIVGGVTYSGVVDTDDLPQEGLTLENAVKQIDGIRIKPVGALTWNGSNPAPQIASPVLPVEVRFFELWLYEDKGIANIELAKSITKTLLHRQYIQTTDFALSYIQWASDLGEPPNRELALGLGLSSMERVRYSVTLFRS